MNGYLKSILGAALLMASTAGPLWADDVKFMDGITPRAGDNPQTEAGKFKKDCGWVIGMSDFGVNANTWTVQVAH